MGGCAYTSRRGANGGDDGARSVRAGNWGQPCREAVLEQGRSLFHITVLLRTFIWEHVQSRATFDTFVWSEGTHKPLQHPAHTCNLCCKLCALRKALSRTRAIGVSEFDACVAVGRIIRAELLWRRQVRGRRRRGECYGWQLLVRRRSLNSACCSAAASDASFCCDKRPHFGQC